MHNGPRYDHYKVLGVAPDATAAVIKRAYRTLAKICHPDHDPSPGAARRFRIVHDAYQTLIDPVKRARFDADLLNHRPLRAATTGSSTRVDRPTATPVVPNRQWTVPRFAFIGLHITGLLFGCTTVSATLLGITWQAWPWYTLLFCLPAALAIPESIDGLRTSHTKGHRP
mgnify:CR=1 FL=1|jgi:hypothetical protein